jgi:type II secretory pathway pseudopilin PulG
MNQKNGKCTQFKQTAQIAPRNRSAVKCTRLVLNRNRTTSAGPGCASGFTWQGARGQAGHTLVEVMVSLSVLAFMVLSLYAGFSSGFAVLRVARENLRATQILAERMEVLRLIKWEDVAPGFIPTTFTAPFYPSDSTSSVTNSAPDDLAYTGSVVITNVPMTESYSDHLRMIQIDLSWTSGQVKRSRQMITYVSKYGLQNYLY